jgi:tetratricopeptide (TPR) repeat protein
LLGAIKIQNGDLNTALEAFQKSRSAWIQAGDQYQINRVEDNIRTTLYYLGDIANLRKAEDTSVQYWEQFPNRIELAMALTNRGLVYGIDGEHEMAIKNHTRAIEISDLLGVPRIQAMTRVNIAGSYIFLEKFEEATNHLQKSLAIQAEHDIKEYWVDTKRSLAEVAIGRKSGQKAMELAKEAAELAREGEEPLEQGAALRTLGQAYHLLGDPDQALQCLVESLGYLRENGFKYESYLTLLAIVRVHKDLGQPEKEREINKEAQILSQQMGLFLPGNTANTTEGD